MRICLIIHIVFVWQTAFASIDSLFPKNRLLFDVAYQYYFHKGDFRSAEAYDNFTHQQINTYSYAPSIAQNKSDFSFGLAYEWRFFKNRRLFIRTGLGYGKVNYGIGFRYDMSKFWDIPSLQGRITDAMYMLDYPYLYIEGRVGYNIPIKKSFSIGIWGGMQLKQFLAKGDIEELWLTSMMYKNRLYLAKFAAVNSFENIFRRRGGLEVGLFFECNIFSKPIQIWLNYHYTPVIKKKLSMISFTYYRVSNYDEMTDEFEFELSGNHLFMNRMRALELSMSIGF